MDCRVASAAECTPQSSMFSKRGRCDESAYGTNLMIIAGWHPHPPHKARGDELRSVRKRLIG